MKTCWVAVTVLAMALHANADDEVRGQKTAAEEAPLVIRTSTDHSVVEISAEMFRERWILFEGPGEGSTIQVKISSSSPVYLGRGYRARNCTVQLICPAGVIVGPDAVIDPGSDSSSMGELRVYRSPSRQRRDQVSRDSERWSSSSSVRN